MMEIVDHLRSCPLLGRLPEAALAELASDARSLGLRGGATLFESGDPPDALYLVTLGRIRILFPDHAPTEVGAGELLGEIGVLADEPRMGRAVAIRDTLLVRIDAESLLRTLEHHPGAQRELTRLIVQRLRRRRPPRGADARSERTLTIMPLTVDAPAEALARGLASALSQLLGGATPVLDAARVDTELGAGTAQTRFDSEAANARLVTWLNAVEEDSEHVIYLADGMPDPWTLRAARQADRILLVAGEGALNTDTLSAMSLADSLAPVELVLTDGAPKLLDMLRERSQARFHHHAAPDSPADCARLARQVTGRALGLVLGGGGARGFAHIGLLRALAESGLEIDLIGGTSIGAFIGALHARGASPDEIREAAHALFIERNHLNDYVWPRVSLIRGRKFMLKLQALLGDGSIEDLRLPFHCVSTNLTRGKPEVHDSGPLAGWVAASMCVPGIAPPVVWNGDLLADGAVVNSLPVDIMRDLARGPLIASDVGSADELRLPGIKGLVPDALIKARGKDRPSLTDILFRMTTLTSDLKLADNLAAADLFLRMPVEDVGMFDWTHMDALIARGHAHAMDVLSNALADWPGDGPPPIVSR
jgi:NTE family protein